MRRKFLSVVLCVCMMLTMAPFAFAADSNDGVATEIGAESGSSNTSSSGSGGTTLQAQINAINSTGTITLNRTYTEDLTIPANKNITLNLNGQTLKNVTTDTITVENGATLTVTGTGTVDNITHGKAALYNKGTVVLEGGTFERSAEAGIDATHNGGNSYYTVLNHGSMTVKSNVTVNNKGHYSSLFENGYFNYTKTQDGIETPSLIIDGGKFDGGLNTIKNDDNATLTINDGTFINYTQAAFQNHHIATINGGTFTATDANAVLNCGVCSEVNSGHDNHATTINNGTFTGAINRTVGTISISGGTYSVDVSDFCAEGYYSVKDGEKYTVKPLNEVAVAKIGDILYPTLAKAIEAVPDDGGNATTVTLIKDSTENVTIPSGKSITLDLNGQILSGGTVASKATVTNNGTITIQDTSSSQTGKIIREDNGAKGYYTIDNQGTMTIKSGIVYNSTGNMPNGSSLIRNAGNNVAATLNITGGNIKQDGFIAVKNDDHGILNVSGGKITTTGDTITNTASAIQNWCTADITGGTINGAIWTSVWSNDLDNATTTIENATVLGRLICKKYDENGSTPPVSKTAKTIIKSGDFDISSWTVGNDCSVEISGGYFTSDPTSYLSTSPKAYTVASNKAGYSYMVTSQEPTKAPVIVKDDTNANLGSSITGDAKEAIETVIDKANIDGTAEAINAIGKAAILKDAAVTEEEQNNKDTKITIDVKVTVTATQANLSGNDSNSKSITFTATPVATVTVGTAQRKTDIKVDNSYLDGKEITVTLPLPTDFTPKQIKHTSVDGTVEYFLDHSERGAKVFTIDKANNCAILKITKFSTFEVRGTQTYVEPSSGGSISAPTTYAVNVNAATNGAVAADKKTASKGTTVTVTASPSKGYVVDAVKVVDKDGKDVAVTEKDGKYVFTMPGSAVTVTGSFKAETPAPVALPFTDVKSGNWFYDAVKYAYAQGLMTGTSATTFAPNGTMNRAMIVTVLYRLEKSPAVTGASKFTDVPAGQWYSDAVAWAAANKIVNGYDETTFGPMNAVTREQMAAILFRYEQVKGLENVTLEENLNRFPDQNKISAYAIPALQWAVGQKIINGNADGTLDPTGTATRAQVAQIFTNLLNK